MFIMNAERFSFCSCTTLSCHCLKCNIFSSHWCIYYMVLVIIGHCGRYKVRVHNWSSHPWQVQLTGVRGGGPSSLPPLHAAQREKGRSVNECSPESHHLLPPPWNPRHSAREQRYPPASAQVSLTPITAGQQGEGRRVKNFNYWCSCGDFVFSCFFVVSRMNVFIGIKMYICHAYRANWIGLEEALSLCAHRAQGWGCVLMGAPPSFSQIPPLLWLWVNVSSC